MARYRLTDRVRETVCSFIRAGGFAHVAAEAAGIPFTVFTRWLRRGMRAKAGSPCRLFYEGVTQAMAQARLAAETRALQKNPLAWLKSGPGRESPTLPGWTNPARPVSRDGAGLASAAETQEVLAALVRLLEPFPEAREAVARGLVEMEGRKPERRKGRVGDEEAESGVTGDGERDGGYPATLDTPPAP